MKDRKLVVQEVIIDISEAITRIWPEFAKERKDSQESLVKALSVAIPIEHKGEQYWVIPKNTIESLGTNLRTVNKMLEKYPLLVYTGNKPCKFYGQAKRYKSTEEYATIMDQFHRNFQGNLMCYYKWENARKGAYVLLSKAPPRNPLHPPDYVCYAHVDTEGIEGFLLMDEFEGNLDITQRITIERMLVMAKQNKGILTQEYFRGTCGRLFSRGVESVQNIPKSVRKAAFKGCYDIDFVNAHYRIAAHFSGQPAINEYAYSPDVIRYLISDCIDVSKDEAKVGLLMLLYGAGTSLRSNSSLVELFGKEKAKEFLSNSRVKLIHQGIQEMKQELLQDGTLEEEEGKTLDQTLAEFLMECEGRILDVCTKHVTPEALFFDGFITKEDVNLKTLESAVANELGISIEMSKQKI